MPKPEQVKIDTGPASDLLTAALAAIGRIRGASAHPTAGEPGAHERTGRSTDRALAAKTGEITRDTLHAAHLCRRAADELEAQYWAARGYPDPLEVD